MADGEMTTEIYLGLTTCFDEGVFTAADILAHLACDWGHPRSLNGLQNNLRKLFHVNRMRKMRENGKSKCNPSDMITLYPVLRHFFAMRCEGVAAVAKEYASFVAVCRVADIILAAKHGKIAKRLASEELLAAQSDYLVKHIDAYGKGNIVPKTHWMFDIAVRIALDPHVIDMFVIERNHLVVKTIAENCRSKIGFSATVLEEVRQQKRSKAVHQRGRRKAAVSDARGYNFHIDDVVFIPLERGVGAGRIMAFSDNIVDLSLLDPVGESRHYSSNWVSTPRRKFVDVSDITPCVAWIGKGVAAKTLLDPLV
jgi:hypothetical protein